MTTAVSEGISNWERMKALVAEARAADPALARRSVRFSAALNRRQDAALAGLAQRPNSRAAKDYARVTGPAFA